MRTVLKLKPSVFEHCVEARAGGIASNTDKPTVTASIISGSLAWYETVSRLACYRRMALLQAERDRGKGGLDRRQSHPFREKRMLRYLPRAPKQ